MSARIFVPGRIEVLGKHIDYAGGSSLLVAVERGFTFEVEPLDGDRIVFVAADSGEEARYAIDRRDGVVRAVSADPASHGGAGSPPVSNIGPAPGQSHGTMRRPGWARYIDGVLAHTLGEFGEAACGALVRFRSDLPVAAGLSSSSALVTGAFLALDAVCRFSMLPSFRRALPDRQALAAFLSAAEMGGPVGTRGGSEDHVAILCAEAGRVVRYGLAPVRYRGAAPVPDGWTFAVAASGVVADKGGAVQGHYNRLSDLAATAARAWVAGRGSPVLPRARSGEAEGERNARAGDNSAARRFDFGEASGDARGRALDLGEASGDTGGRALDLGEASGDTGGRALDLGEAGDDTGGRALELGDASGDTGGRAIDFGEASGDTRGRALDLGEAGGDTGGRALNLGAVRERGWDADSVVVAIRTGAAALGEDPVPLVRRARHFLEECALVDVAFEALRLGDVGAFAGAVNRSATVGAELLENQVPETLRLTALARALGAPAASPFGGGFGGAVWALVREVDAERFIAGWRDRYHAAFPHRSGAEFFETRAAPAAGRVGT